MSISYTYDSVQNLVLTEVAGVVSVNELLQYTNDVSRDMNVMPGFIEIVDLAEVIDLEISYKTAKKLSKSWDEWRHKSHQGSIIYAPADLTYGTVRMLQSLMNSEGGSEEKLYLVTRNKENVPRLINKMKNKQDSLHRSIKFWNTVPPSSLSRNNL